MVFVPLDFLRHQTQKKARHCRAFFIFSLLDFFCRPGFSPTWALSLTLLSG
jgi:hypothetical protein